MEIKFKHYADLRLIEKTQLYTFLEATFGKDNYTEIDFNNCLGGVHYLIYKNNDIIGHVSIIHRNITINEDINSVCYIESMAIAKEYQKQGLGSKLMELVNKYIIDQDKIGMLCASTKGIPLYLKMGWSKILEDVYEYKGEKIVDSHEETIMIYNYHQSLEKIKLIADYRPGDVW